MTPQIVYQPKTLYSFNSKLSEVISLRKIIGSYCGGLILTNNKKLFLFLKSKQNLLSRFQEINHSKNMNVC